MAPVLPRLSHTLPGYYPPIRGAPPIPISGPKNITLKAILELFTGTFCIFVVAVLIWKLGNFFRRFTMEKVLGGGNSPARRYVKAWYGWVPLQRQKAKTSIVQQCFAKVRQWATWNSAKNSYCSIWWSFNHTELEACKQDSMCQRHWRTHLKKRKPTTANAIRSPCGHAFRSGQGAGSCYSSNMAGVLQSDKMVNTCPERYKLPRRQRRRLSSVKELFKDDLRCVAPATRAKQSTMALKYCTIQAGRPSARSLNHKRFLSLDQSACVLTRKDIFFYISNNDPLAKPNHSLPRLSDLKITFRRVGKRAEGSSNSQRPTDHRRKSRNLRALIYSRKYQVWSAQMGLNVPECGKYSKHQFSVPPGSPRSELLTEFSSHRTTLAKMINEQRTTACWSSLSDSSGLSISGTQKRRVERASVISYKAKVTTTKARQPTTMLFRQDRCQSQTTLSVSKHPSHVQFDRFQCPSTRLRKSIWSQRSDKEGRPQSKKKANMLGTTSAQFTIPLRHLSSWEIMLIDGLDRRLGWLSQQLIPGRRPFHFPLLPNHWLNIRTWIVYDPASRAPIDAKRQFGDPRFNTPSPTSQNPKRKYPEATRKVANTPRIESWRIAVNRNRRASGLRDLVKRLELYDDSADDPPDGYIDPACWLIRKPPQGYQLSARQNATYYEGGAGWQERLEDWQNIRRGYRIRKAIHEGRANRTRAKQVAVGLTRFYQKAYRQQI
ncbi:hypothetical protein ANOM_000265 [Aspergillus nomiae NRRL 13137]|uniref:Uncharacterized protein n=1 Tax=Aspergillus nomiae NRRL (strain ATCC 15546 / NRRL 13137 / CBS 260.88 / M93) TaxID=1509407 RepID=A0A0L1JIL9_ASPN3|nr:uncharacterized protein ANOM_000265 [Aspergillus nomiae NRRL 13137]KNG91615.1 hypothetical protein ANOM_000265 [Aspergillus nomiae NRRL 13137]